MDDISDVTITPCEKSLFVKPLRLTFKQNGKNKIWDAVEVHDSVVILIFNKSRNVFILVKQFRPAVYLAASEVTTENGVRRIDSSKNPASRGITYELCAGIVDKNLPLDEIAQAEVLEECGYKIPLDKLERVSSYRSNVGASGSLQHMFFAEVTDAMKVSDGGGLVEEGEMIDVVELPVSEGKTWILDSSVCKPVAAMFSMMWFYDEKYKTYLDESVSKL